MKKSSKNQNAKYFKYSFSKTMIALAITVILLCLVGIVISIYRLVKFGGVDGFTDALKSPLLIAICLFCIVTVIALLVKSQYIVDETHYTTQFGFIISRFPIKDITSLVLDMDTKKLTIYMGEQFSVLSLSPEWNDEFIAAIRAVNPEIEFSFTLAETDGKEEK